MHVSIAGGMENAPERSASLGCRSFQMFMGSPRSWRPPLDPDTAEGARSIAAFRERRGKLSGGVVAGHARYLINLLSSNVALRRKSLDMFLREAVLADRAGAEFFVLHPGQCTGSLAEAEKRLRNALREVLRNTGRVVVLLEGTAQRPDRPGGNLALLGGLAASDERLGLCLDLAHLVAQGYDFRHAGEVDRLLGDVKAACGLAGIRLLHGNDSKFPAGSFRDRHQHVARGALGKKGYLNILSRGVFRRLPWLLETPKTPKGSDRRNLRRLRQLAEEALTWTSIE